LIEFSSLVTVITKTMYIRPRQRLYLNVGVKYEKISVNSIFDEQRRYSQCL